MKKIILGVMLLVGIGTSQLNAQSVSYGVKAEANMSNFLLSNKIKGESRMKLGATVGGFAKIDVVENFAIQPELLFHYQSSTMKATGAKKRDFGYWGVEVPVYALGQWNVNSGDRFYAGVGPYVGYGFNARYKDPEVKLYKTDALQHWDFGVKALVGYEFSNRIQINATYKIGVINAVDKGDGKMNPEVVSLGIGYRF